MRYARKSRRREGGSRMERRVIEHLLWDWNGTLLDDVDHCVSVVNAMLGKEGLPGLSRDDYQAHFDFPVINYYRRVGFSTTPDSFARLSESFVNAFNAGVGRCRVHTGALECVRAWHARGGRQAVLSASRQDYLEHLVSQFGLADYFEALGGIGDIYAAGKIERGHGMLDQLQWDPNKTLLIGDTRHDFDVAQALDVHCLLVASGHQSEARLRKTGAEVVRELSAEQLGKTRYGALFGNEPARPASVR